MNNIQPIITNKRFLITVSLLNLLISTATLILSQQIAKTHLKPILSPVISIVEVEPEKDIKPSQIEQKGGKKWQGIASYYSRAGCVGCSPTLTMANGEPLDDSKLTVAFNKIPLNSTVQVCNKMNGKCTVARVTDTGGFERLNRIIDLSVATKEIINCTDLCEVEITEIE